MKNLLQILLETTLLFILLFLIVTEVNNQWTSDPSVNTLICNSSGNIYNSVMISDDSGGAIMVWEDYRSGSYSDIYA
jgi:hypothetical protein